MNSPSHFAHSGSKVCSWPHSLAMLTNNQPGRLLGTTLQTTTSSCLCCFRCCRSRRRQIFEFGAPSLVAAEMMPADQDVARTLGLRRASTTARPPAALSGAPASIFSDWKAMCVASMGQRWSQKWSKVSRGRGDESIQMVESTLKQKRQQQRKQQQLASRAGALTI